MLPLETFLNYMEKANTNVQPAEANKRWDEAAFYELDALTVATVQLVTQLDRLVELAQRAEEREKRAMELAEEAVTISRNAEASLNAMMAEASLDAMMDDG